MASFFETAGMNQLNGSFWSQTNTYNVTHLNSCWDLVKTWLDSLNFLTFKESTSTYIDASSLTTLGDASENSTYRDYIVSDFDAPLPVVLRVRVCYRGSRSASYKNTVVIECRISYGDTWTPWSYITYTDPNDNAYTNNRQLGAPYSLYLSNDCKALCFTQGFFLSSSNSGQGYFPMASHGILIEYSDADNTLYGDVTYSSLAIQKYTLSAYQTSNDVGKCSEHASFKISNNILSPLRLNYLPFRGGVTAVQHASSFGYTYKNFIAITEPGAAPGGFNLTVDGVSSNYAPTHFGFTMGTPALKGRLVPAFTIPTDYYFYPIAACCIYALVD